MFLLSSYQDRWRLFVWISMHIWCCLLYTSLMGNQVCLVICILRKPDFNSYLDHSVRSCAVTLKINAKGEQFCQKRAIQRTGWKEWEMKDCLVLSESGELQSHLQSRSSLWEAYSCLWSDLCGLLFVSCSYFAPFGPVCWSAYLSVSGCKCV